MYLSDGVSQCSKKADVGHRETWFLYLGGVRGPDLSEYVEQFILCLKKLLHGVKKVPANRKHMLYTFMVSDSEPLQSGSYATNRP